MTHETAVKANKIVRRLADLREKKRYTDVFGMEVYLLMRFDEEDRPRPLKHLGEEFVDHLKGYIAECIEKETARQIAALEKELEEL